MKALRSQALDCRLCNEAARPLGIQRCLADWQTGLFRCEHCHSLFRSPMPEPAAIDSYYEGVAFRISARILRRRLRKSSIQARHLDEALRAAGVKPDELIVDLGAGIGGLVHALGRRGYTRVEGLEPREKARACAADALGVQLKNGWILDAPSLVGQARVLVLSHVLEHLTDPVELVGYLRKHYPGSLLWIEVPNGELDSLALNGKVAWRLWLEQHLWSFTRTGLAELFRREGGKILRTQATCYSRLAERIRRRSLQAALGLWDVGAEDANGGSSLRKLGRLLPLLLSAVAGDCVERLAKRLGFPRIPDSPFNIEMLVQL